MNILSNSMHSSMLENIFMQTSDPQNYTTGQADLLYIQFAATKRTQITIPHYGAKLWNTLCNVIQVDCAISTFQQKLKIFLLPWVLFLICCYLSFFLFLLIWFSFSGNQLTFIMHRTPCFWSLWTQCFHELWEHIIFHVFTSVPFLWLLHHYAFLFVLFIITCHVPAL